MDAHRQSFLFHIVSLIKMPLRFIESLKKTGEGELKYTSCIKRKKKPLDLLYFLFVISFSLSLDSKRCRVAFSYLP